MTRADHYARVKVFLERRDELAQTDASDFQDSLARWMSDDYRRRLDPSLRPRTDRLLSNVGHALAVPIAHEVCAEQLRHRLKSRRLAATKLLRRIDFGASLTEPLRSAVREYQDNDALELLCRIPGGLGGFGCCQLINLVPDNVIGDPDTYVMGLILARLWIDGDLDHEHPAAEHLVAYLRALGRTRDISVADIAIRAVELSEDWEALLMAASAFGRCQLTTGVEAVASRCEALAADNDGSSDGMPGG